MLNSERSLALLCVSLSLGLAANALLGPLVAGVIDYRYTETFGNQGLGLDAFTLALVVPALILAGLLSARGNSGAPFLALSSALMAMYMLPQYVLGAHYNELPGNNEDFFLLHLGLFVLGGVVAFVAWRAVDSDRLPSGSRRSQIWTGTLLFVMAAFLALRYIPFLFGMWNGHASAEYLNDPLALWLIAFMDLGMIMPVAIACGASLLLRNESARKPTYAIVGWFAFVGPAVAAMAFTMKLNGDPNGSLGGAVAFTVYGVIFALVAAYLLRPLFRTRGTARD